MYTDEYREPSRMGCIGVASLITAIAIGMGLLFWQGILWMIGQLREIL